MDVAATGETGKVEEMPSKPYAKIAGEISE